MNSFKCLLQNLLISVTLVLIFLAFYWGVLFCFLFFWFFSHLTFGVEDSAFQVQLSFHSYWFCSQSAQRMPNDCDHRS